MPRVREGEGKTDEDEAISGGAEKLVVALRTVRFTSAFSKIRIEGSSAGSASETAF